MAKYLTTQQACDALKCQRSKFYQCYRDLLDPVRKQKGSKSWLWDAEAVKKLAAVESAKGWK